MPAKKRPPKSARKPPGKAAEPSQVAIFTPGGLPSHLLALRPRNCDAKLVRELLGGRHAAGLDEVALEFGVSRAEVDEWVKQGMPMPAQDGDSRLTATAPSPPSDFYPPSARNCELLRALDVDPYGHFSHYAALLGWELTAKTQPAVAKAFGVHPQTISSWLQIGMPKPAEGTPYLLIPILQWRIQRDRQQDRD